MMSHLLEKPGKEEMIVLVHLLPSGRSEVEDGRDDVRPFRQESIRQSSPQ